MEIEVGEYIRTRDGVIAKVENIETYYADKVYWFDKVIYRDYEDGIEHLYDYKLEEYILNHSKNPIDLIEVGDYVNGEYVSEITKNYITVGKITYGIKDLKGIKSIVTKEAYKNIEYRLE